MHKIGEIHPVNGPTMAIYYDNRAEVNPYRVYLEWYECTPTGCKKRKRQVERYADLYSCSIVMMEHCQRHNEERR